MSKSYYLMNGNNRVGQALYIKVGDKVKKQFDDISSLDLVTMDIKKKEAKPILREVNKGNSIDGMFYDLCLQCNNKVNSYAPIFDYDKDILKKYYDELRYYAELRDYKVKHNQKLKLDYNSRLDDYVKGILSKIIDNNITSLTEFDSIISKKIKDIIKDKNNGMYYCSAAHRYLDSKSHLIEDIYSNYPEIRNLTLTYILYLAGYTTNVRTLIGRTENWNNLGIKSEAFPETVINCEQMQLADFINAPRVKKLDKKGNPLV